MKLPSLNDAKKYLAQIPRRKIIFLGIIGLLVLSLTTYLVVVKSSQQNDQVTGEQVAVESSPSPTPAQQGQALLTSSPSPSPTPTTTPSTTPKPTVKPTAKPTIKPTTTPSPSPAKTQPGSGNFTTLSLGAGLPSEADCASRVNRSSFEPRPGNTGANQTKGSSGVKVDGASDSWNSAYAPRINGNFTGTTDEIIQWGACKWGFNVDMIRAIATQESWWHQSTVGDNGESFGLLQVKRTVHIGTYPAAQNSTAFNVDYTLAWKRACFDGDFSWMKEKNGSYSGGDEWGCTGAWFSGSWYDGGANGYISSVRSHLSNKTWLTQDF